MFFFSSCYSYKIFPKEDRHFVYTGDKKTAFIINPQLRKETKIIKQSGVFDLTTDSNAANIKVRLHPIRRGFTCGNGLIGYAMLLGQVPIYFPDRYFFKFDEVQGSDTLEKNISLQVAKKMWFWSFLVFDKKFKKKAGHHYWQLTTRRTLPKKNRT